MKLLIVNQHPQDVLGGSEIQCNLIGTWLSRFGHQISYFAVKSKSTVYNQEYNVIPQRNYFFFDLYHTLKSVKPQLVYWRYNKKHLLIAVLLSKLFGAKIVFSISTYSDTQAWIWTGVAPLEGFINHYRQAKSIKSMLASFKLFFDPLKSWFNYLGFYLIDGVVGIQKKLTHVVPVRKQISIYNSMDPSASDGFHWPKRYVVWVANIKSKKNPEAYIELAKSMIEEDVDFLMIGKIQQPHYYELLKKEHLPTNLHYLGAKTPEEVDNILQSSFFLVHTCNPEGFGNNFIQAWFQGKPTITLYFDPDDIIKEHQLGFHSGSIEKLVEDTTKVIRDEALRKATGMRAKDFAMQNFVPEQNAKKFEKFFREVLKSDK